jgi:hypothetical protein
LIGLQLRNASLRQHRDETRQPAKAVHDIDGVAKLMENSPYLPDFPGSCLFSEVRRAAVSKDGSARETALRMCD